MKIKDGLSWGKLILLLLFITLLLYALRDKKYYAIPASLVGHWTGVDLSSITGMTIRSEGITLISDDGKDENCDVDMVYIEYGWFNREKKTRVHCKTDTENALMLNLELCGVKQPLKFWTISVVQEDAELDYFSNAIAVTEPSCGKTSAGDLGIFAKETIP